MVPAEMDREKVFIPKPVVLRNRFSGETIETRALSQYDNRIWDILSTRRSKRDLEIRSKKDAGVRRCDLARAYNVSESRIDQILSRTEPRAKALLVQDFVR